MHLTVPLLNEFHVVYRMLDLNAVSESGIIIKMNIFNNFLESFDRHRISYYINTQGWICRPVMISWRQLMYPHNDENSNKGTKFIWSNWRPVFRFLLYGILIRFFHDFHNYGLDENCFEKINFCCSIGMYFALIVKRKLNCSKYDVSLDHSNVT